jgi:flagellar biosynthesis/type III secretory pathway protein FliH
MAILRSRTVEHPSLGLTNPGVARALHEWQQRVEQAGEEGRQAGRLEAAERLAEAERRAVNAEHTAAANLERQHADFLARFEPVLAALNAAAGRLEPLEKQLIQESEAELVRLALAVAAAVLRRAVATDPAWMDALVKRALLLVPDRRAIAIRMHPRDAASLRERLNALTARLPGLERLEVVADDTLAPGACILQSQGSRFDASLIGCWERLADGLLDATPASDCAELADGSSTSGAPPKDGALGGAGGAAPPLRLPASAPGGSRPKGHEAVPGILPCSPRSNSKQPGGADNGTLGSGGAGL